MAKQQNSAPHNAAALKVARLPNVTDLRRLPPPLCTSSLQFSAKVIEIVDPRNVRATKGFASLCKTFLADRGPAKFVELGSGHGDITRRFKERLSIPGSTFLETETRRDGLFSNEHYLSSRLHVHRYDIALCVAPFPDQTLTMLESATKFLKREGILLFSSGWMWNAVCLKKLLSFGYEVAVVRNNLIRGVEIESNDELCSRVLVAARDLAPLAHSISGFVSFRCKTTIERVVMGIQSEGRGTLFDQEAFGDLAPLSKAQFIKAALAAARQGFCQIKKDRKCLYAHG